MLGTKPGYVQTLIRVGLICVLLLPSSCESSKITAPVAEPSRVSIPLPEPRLEGDTSVEAALAARRSVREYTGAPLTLADLGQLLWAAQGVTGANQRYRTAPSAGALYPLSLYVVVGDVDDLATGVYRYVPSSHGLMEIGQTDQREALAEAAVGQSWVEQGAAVLVFVGIYERTTAKYGSRGRQYVHMEAGHAAQNVYLQATALDLGTVAVGAFDDAAVQRVIGLGADEVPLYLMPVGHLR